MSLILDKSNQNFRSYLPLNLEKLLNMTVYALASTNIEKINTKLGQNVCDHKTLAEFNYGSNLTRTV